MAAQLRTRPFAKFSTGWVRRADATYAAPGNAQPDCPLAEADTYMPGVVCARQQFLKQPHGPKVAGALWMYGPDHVCSTSWRRIAPDKMTPVGSEPTPFRNGTLSQRLT
jgi:hypothetical protein